MAAGHLPTSVGIYPEDLVFAARTEEIHWEHCKNDGYGRLWPTPIFGRPNVGQSNCSQPVLANQFWVNPFSNPMLSNSGAPKRHGPPKGGWPTISRFFFHSLATIFFLSLSRCFFRGNLVGV